MGFNSVLMHELRQNLGITYKISTIIPNNKHGSIITGSLRTDSSTANRAILAIKEVLIRLKRRN